MKNKTNNDETDLIEIIQILIKNKLKIFLITLFFLTIGTIYKLSNKEDTVIKAVTEINPISTFEENKYRNYNIYSKKYFSELRNINFELRNINFYKTEEEKDFVQETNEYIFYVFDKNFLLELFISKLNEKNVIFEAIDENNLIDKSKYSSELEYFEEISRITSTVKLIPPIFDKERLINITNWRVEYKTKDKDIENWEKILASIQVKINLQIVDFLKNSFENVITSEIKLRNYIIEDIDIKIASLIEKYENEMQNRIAYLTEQSILARSLNIKSTNSTFTTTTIWSPDNEDLKLRTEIPYYTRGYELIEKEIELIKGRKDIKSFIYELPKLNENKKLLETNKNIERLKEIFYQTPIANKNEFSAGKLLLNSTEYINISNNRTPSFLLFFLFGLTFSILFVIMQYSYKKRKNKFIK